MLFKEFKNNKKIKNQGTLKQKPQGCNFDVLM